MPTLAQVRRNRRFRLLLANYPGPPLAISDPLSGQTRQLIAGLRDADADEDGISSLGSIQSSLPPDFDATNGATGTASSRGVLLDCSGFSSLLNTSGAVRFAVPISNLESYPASISYYFGKSGGQLEKLTSGSGYTRSRFPEDSAEIRIYTSDATRDGIQATGFVELAAAWDASTMYYILDGLPFDKTRGAADAASSLDSIAMVGLPTGGGTGNELTMRDFELRTGAPDFTANADYGKVVFFGDSFVTQGSLHSAQVNNTNPFWNPGYGFASGGAANTSGSYTSDTGLIAAFFRECFKGGLIVGSNNHNDAESGDQTGACKTRCETWTASNTADIAVIHIGVNDAADATEFNTAKRASLIADYKAIVDACVSAGCSRVVVPKITSLRNNTSYQNAVADSNTAYINGTVIPTIWDYHPAVVGVDLYAATGGYTPDSTMFQSNNVHPNLKGQHVIGQALGAALMGSF